MIFYSNRFENRFAPLYLKSWFCSTYILFFTRMRPWSHRLSLGSSVLGVHKASFLCSCCELPHNSCHGSGLALLPLSNLCRFPGFAQPQSLPKRRQEPQCGFHGCFWDQGGFYFVLIPECSRYIEWEQQIGNMRWENRTYKEEQYLLEHLCKLSYLVLCPLLPSRPGTVKHFLTP